MTTLIIILLEENKEKNSTPRGKKINATKKQSIRIADAIAPTQDVFREKKQIYELFNHEKGAQPFSF